MFCVTGDIIDLEMFSGKFCKLSMNHAQITVFDWMQGQYKGKLSKDFEHILRNNKLNECKTSHTCLLH